MKIPTLRGVIDRRILVNFRADPDVLAKILPEPFEPKLINGVGMAGVCLIRLKDLRPSGLPPFVGVGSENAAHRIAVRWRDGNSWREGVFIPRRDTASRFNAIVGGRIFPGYHHHANFRVQEQEGHYKIALDSDDGVTHLRVAADPATNLPASSIFGSLEEASRFFERGSVGYSPGGEAGAYQGLQLHTDMWKVRPLAARLVQSSFFSNTNLFPPGSVEFDCALLMTGIEHEWYVAEDLCATAESNEALAAA